MAIWEPAFAKVNLYLHVTGRLENGYHLLDSLMVFAKAGDRLRFEAASVLHLEISGPFGKPLDADDDNLVLRAARALQKFANCSKGAFIHLEKNLPIAAGIGGGSADCAAALKGLNKLWDLNLSLADLSTIGLELGADVPICLHSRTAKVTGIGEDIQPVSGLPSCAIVLVNPMKALSTPAVFKARTGAFGTQVSLPPSMNFQDLVQFLEGQNNDLTAPAIDLVPEIANCLEALSKTQNCALSRMSGSGATCFGLYQDFQMAEEAAQHLKQNHPDWWICPAEVKV